MIKSAAQPPAERKAYINRCINEIAQLPNDETVKAFDIRIEPSMLTVRSPLRRSKPHTHHIVARHLRHSPYALHLQREAHAPLSPAFCLPRAWLAR
jgi:hypothetical protein